MSLIVVGKWLRLSKRRRVWRNANGSCSCLNPLWRGFKTIKVVELKTERKWKTFVENSTRICSRQKWRLKPHKLSKATQSTSQYVLPLCLLFIDYEKAFDSVELNAVFKALIERGIDPNYVELIKEANTGCSTDIKLFHRDVRIPIGKGVRQGDPISPKLFLPASRWYFEK